MRGTLQKHGISEALEDNDTMLLFSEVDRRTLLFDLHLRDFATAACLVAYFLMARTA